VTTGEHARTEQEEDCSFVFFSFRTADKNKCFSVAKTLGQV